MNRGIVIRILAILLFVVGVIAIGIYLMFPGLGVIYNPSSQGMLKAAPYYVDRTGWTHTFTQELKGLLTYSFGKSSGDTLKYLQIHMKNRLQPHSIALYVKDFQEGEIGHHIEYDATDSILYYTFRVSEPHNRVFRLGEYLYRFRTGAYSDDELGYYLLHMDSLNRLKGDDLPELPNLNEDASP